MTEAKALGKVPGKIKFTAPPHSPLKDDKDLLKKKTLNHSKCEMYGPLKQKQ